MGIYAHSKVNELQKYEMTFGFKAHIRLPSVVILTTKTYRLDATNFTFARLNLKWNWVFK